MGTNLVDPTGNGRGATCTLPWDGQWSPRGSRTAAGTWLAPSRCRPGARCQEEDEDISPAAKGKKMNWYFGAALRWAAAGLGFDGPLF
jgi:hypothetical protein